MDGSVAPARGAGAGGGVGVIRGHRSAPTDQVQEPCQEGNTCVGTDCGRGTPGARQALRNLIILPSEAHSRREEGTMRIPGFADRSPWDVVRHAVGDFFADDMPTYAAALSFHLLL